MAKKFEVSHKITALIPFDLVVAECGELKFKEPCRIQAEAVLGGAVKKIGACIVNRDNSDPDVCKLWARLWFTGPFDLKDKSFESLEHVLSSDQVSITITNGDEESGTVTYP